MAGGNGIRAAAGTASPCATSAAMPMSGEEAAEGGLMAKMYRELNIDPHDL
jgi:hypothetical protein